VVRIHVLRHGEVASHRGDVPITSDAVRRAFEVGRGLGRREPVPVLVLCGDTRRASDTAAHLARGVADVGATVLGPRVAFALRNPDLYLAGTRVDMVSTADTFAEQVEGLDAEDVASHEFYSGYLASPDRIGLWMNHDSPPGETAGIVAARFRAFARSLIDRVPADAGSVVAVTHSPLVRAVGVDLLGRDIGEPPFVAGLLVEVAADGTMVAEVFEPEAG
jgi:broad specificity phosphatase PhoE